MVLAGAALLSSVYWAPLLVDLLTVGAHPTQNRWFGAGHAALPRLDFDQVLSYGGFLFCVYQFKHDKIARALAMLMLGVLLWYAVGLALALNGTPVLHTKAWPLFLYANRAGLVLALFALCKRFKLHNQAAIGVVLLSLTLGASAQINKASNSRLIKSAISARKSDSAERFARLERKLGGLKEKVVLTSSNHVMTFTSAFDFLVYNEHFAHPSSQYEQRFRFLEALSKAPSELGCYALRHNVFDAVDFVSLDKHRYTRERDDFPKGYRRATIRFPKDFFDSSCFQQVVGGKHGWYKVIDPGKDIWLNSAAQERARLSQWVRN